MTLNPRLFALILLAFASAAHGQGSLTPPGPPGMTMKSLDQIEARTPIPGGSAPVTISAAGSYYLTGNLTVTGGDAITITAAGVSLDLNGFTVATTANPAAGTAVKISARRVTVSNGVVAGAGSVSGATFSGAGFQNGVIWTGSIPQSVTVRDVMVTGCSLTGIKASLVERCTLQNIGTTGISGTIVRGCQVDPCGGTAIYAQVASDCIASGYTQGISGGILSNCSGSTNGDTGIGLSATTAQNCGGSAFGTGGTGLIATTAQNCVGTTFATSTTGQAGLGSTTAQNCVGTAPAGTNATGLMATTAVGCQGTAGGGIGLNATEAATASQGTSDTNIGLKAKSASGCTGTTTTGAFGVSGDTLSNCRGSATDGTGAGLSALSVAINCNGSARGASGLGALNAATNCFGSTYSINSAGIDCPGTANTCRGYNDRGGITIATTIAIGCTSANGTISAPGGKFLGTP